MIPNTLVSPGTVSQNGIGSGWPVEVQTGNTIGVQRRPRRSDFPDTTDGFNEWCKRQALFLAWISDPSIRVVHGFFREAMMLYNRYTGTNTGKNTTPFDTSGTAFATNFHYQNYIYRIISNKCGQFASRKVAISANAYNSHVESRKEQFLAGYAMDRLTRELVGDTMARELRAAGNGLPDSEGLEAKHGKGNGMEGYKDQYAESIQLLLKDWEVRHRFREWLARQYKIWQITGTYVAMPRVNESTMDVEIPFLDPVNYVFDVSSKDNNFKDAKYGILLEYRSIEDVLYEYPHLTEKQLEEKGGGTPSPTNLFGLSLWQNVPGGGRQVLVMTCRFTVNERMEVDAGGEEEFTALVDGENPFIIPAPAEGEKKVNPNGEEVYEVVLIGSDVVAKAGKMKWQCRTIESPLKANLGIITARFDQGVSVYSPPPLVRAASFQDMASLVLKKIAEVVNDIGPATLIVDESQVLPAAGETMAQAFERALTGYLKDKIVPVNGAYIDEMQRESGSRRDFVTVIPSQGGEQIERLMNALQFYIAQLNEVMSWSPQSSGNISPYQAQKTAQLAIAQAQYGTWEEDEVFKRAAEQTLKQVADMLKLIEYKKARDNEKKKVPIGLNAGNMLSFRIGDKALNNFQSNGYLTTDLGIEIEIGRSAEDMRLEMEQAMILQLQSGNLSMEDYVYYKSETDPFEGAKKLQFMLESKRMAAEAQQQQQVQLQQQQMQLMAQQGDADRAARIEGDKMKAATTLAAEQLKIEGA